MNFNSNNHYRISINHHIIFWLVFFAITVIRWGGNLENYGYALKTTLIGFPIHMILVYLNIYILMPLFVYKKKYLHFIVLITSAILFMVVAKFNLTYFLVTHDVWPEGPEVINSITLNYTIDMFIGELYVITFVTAIKITFDFLAEHKRVADLEKTQLETELLFLKTQISPHFFFNTLNNIYSLALVNSNKTSQIIQKLSELMRYLLYETKHKYQTLEKEILCIQNYLDLEKVRHDDLLEVNLTISGNIQDKKIAPILLLSFIENAFKHGVNKNIGKIKIDIDFTIKQDFLYFTVSNPMPAIANQERSFDYSSGIGIENVKKRLALRYDKNDYQLTFDESNNLYVVTLKIKV